MTEISLKGNELLHIVTKRVVLQLEINELMRDMLGKYVFMVGITFFMKKIMFCFIERSWWQGGFGKY